MSRDEWVKILESLASELSDEDKRIAAALAEGRSLADIGRMLGGQHRSMIWRKAQRIRTRANAAG